MCHTNSISQNPKGEGRGNSCLARLAHTKLVRKSLQVNEKTTSTFEDEQEFAKTTNSPGRSSPDVAKTEPSGLPLIRKSLEQYKLHPVPRTYSWHHGDQGQPNSAKHTWLNGKHFATNTN